MVHLCVAAFFPSRYQMGSGGAHAEGGRTKDKGRPDGHIPFIVYAYTRKAGQAEGEGTSASAGFAFVAYAAAAASARVFPRPGPRPAEPSSART